MNVSRKDIDHVVGQIVERFAPQRILLFGWRAYGEPTVSSDVDLLVIMDIEDTPLHAAARISEVVDHDVPLDIIVRTPEASSSHLANHSLFEHRIHQDGVCLYEATDRGMDSERGERLDHRAARDEQR